MLLPALTFLLCFTFHLLALKLFPKLNLLDQPKKYNLKRNPIPYPTGILCVITFLLIFTTFSNVTVQALGVILGVTLLGLISFIDDRHPLPSWLRLFIQILVAILIFATGTRIYTITNPLEGIAGMGDLIKLDLWDLAAPWVGPLPIVSGFFTVVWLGLTINALNWFDGIPGQVSVLSVIAFTIIGLLSLSDRVNQPEIALLCFIIGGISMAALCFDIPLIKSNRVLMGDTGAMFFGLLIGVLTIYAGGKVATAFLVLGVPLIDSLIVVTQRILKGRNPLKGSQSGEHLHHKLLSIGWSPLQIIALTAVLGSTFGITALFLSTKEKFVAAIVLALILIGLHTLTSRKLTAIS